jgi:hypothetical protein
VRALLDDPAAVEDDEPVHAGDRAQPVRHHERGPALHEPPQRLLDEDLALGVQRAGRLVEQQDRRVAQDRPGEGDPLALSAGQLHAALADHGVEAVRQRVGELRDVRRLGRAADLGVGGVRPGERDVLPQRAVEHRRVLRHVRDQAAQVGLAQPADVLAADQDPAGVDVRHPQQQPGERGLAAAGPADEADLRPAGHGQVEALEQRLARRRGRRSPLEADVGGPGRSGSGDAGSSTVGGVSSSSVNCAASVIELSRRR